MIDFIGDISKADAEVLADFAIESKNILEFGVGASTQVLQYYRGEGSTMLSIDTSPEWIERTWDNLSKLKIPGVHRLMEFKNWKAGHVIGQENFCDFIFDDGVDHLRLQFGLMAFDYLKVGGYLAMHDTRRTPDARNFLEIVAMHHNEIDLVQMNVNHSNISYLRKKVPEPYINWQLTEGKEPWQYGLAPTPQI